MKKLIIYGTGLIAELAEFYFRTDSDYKVVAFTNAGEFVDTDYFLGKPLVPFESIEEIYSSQDYEVFIALGYLKTNQIRQSRYLEAKKKGFKLASYISSQATYFGTPVGDNCFILENNVIQPFVTIGNNVTLWSGNHIGHHSTIHDNVFIASHVVISGACIVRENAFIGVNATLRDNIELGPFSVVGAGAVVMKNCEERILVLPRQSTYKKIEKDLI